MIQIQGVDRVELTQRIDDVRQRVAAIESKFGVGGEFQTALDREMNKLTAAEFQPVNSTQKTTNAQNVLNNSQPVNEAEIINSAKVAEALNKSNANNNANNNSANNSTTGEIFGATASSGKIMQNNDGGYSSPEVVSEKVIATATKYGVNPKLANAVAIAESSLNQQDISDAGAIGVMQLMPDTAESLGVNPYDEDENIDGGVRFLKTMLDRFDGNVPLAVAAYNAGPGAVQKYGGVPPYKETQAYVGRVMDLYK